jgi:hypothetical protein
VPEAVAVAPEDVGVGVADAPAVPLPVGVAVGGVPVIVAVTSGVGVGVKVTGVLVGGAGVFDTSPDTGVQVGINRLGGMLVGVALRMESGISRN